VGIISNNFHASFTKVWLDVLVVHLRQTLAKST
jgi:hypothetical protein